MVAALLVLAADEADKTPFYIAGILLVVFAVLISLAGLRMDSFPTSKGARNGVCALAAVLVAATMAAAVLSG
jgi:hypothetical protein